jgi:hypothetical protein
MTGTTTATGTATSTATVTSTYTATSSPTITSTVTVTGTPTLTGTPSPTAIPNTDIFYVSQNAFTPSQQSVSIYVAYSEFPGNYSLNVYNTAGEHIKTLDSQYLTAPLSASYDWDGTNKYGDQCASGMYIFYLSEPFSTKLKRVLLIR